LEQSSGSLSNGGSGNPDTGKHRFMISFSPDLVEAAQKVLAGAKLRFGAAHI
jgi:hypothetical protein